MKKSLKDASLASLGLVFSLLESTQRCPTPPSGSSGLMPPPVISVDDVTMSGSTPNMQKNNSQSKVKWDNVQTKQTSAAIVQYHFQTIAAVVQYDFQTSAAIVLNDFPQLQRKNTI